ncbi:MAG TPA: acyltransferase [Cyanobacteria bacterium UBA11162]|nr:acyltransferase [Cyanobacteria bacterium UBA11162]
MAQKIYLKKLDAIRGFAASYIVITHWMPSLMFVPEIIHKGFFSFGQEIVMLFFLLSGFGIYLSFYRNPDLGFKSYFIRRFRRIYFPFLLALLLSIVIVYLNGKVLNTFPWRELIGNLLMVQDISELKPGTWVEPFLGNLPLWALSYEWWFYLLFYPCYKFLFKNPNRIYFILLFSFVSYLTYLIIPNQASLIFSYFIVWWCGLEAAEVFIRQRRFTFTNMKSIMFCLVFMSTLAAIPVLAADQIRFGYYPFLIFRHFVAAFLAIFIGLLWYSKRLIYFDTILGIFTVVAPISYGIYLFHYPLLIRWELSSYLSNVWIVYSIKFALILGLAYLTEVKLQPLVNRWIK